MATSAEMPRRGGSDESSKPLNWEAIEAISGYDDATIRKMLEEADVAQLDVYISEDDFSEIRSQAMVLGSTLRTKMDTLELLEISYVDRMRATRGTGDEAIQNIPDSILKRSLFAETGYVATDAEVAALRLSPLGFEAWVKKRAEAKDIKSFDVAVAQDGGVVASGSTAAEALRRAQDNNGRER